MRIRHDDYAYDQDWGEELEEQQAPDLIAEAERLMERLQQAAIDIYCAYADYDTPAGAPLPPAASQRLDRLAAVRERAADRLERRDIADLPF